MNNTSFGTYLNTLTFTAASLLQFHKETDVASAEFSLAESLVLLRVNNLMKLKIAENCRAPFYFGVNFTQGALRSDLMLLHYTSHDNSN